MPITCKKFITSVFFLACGWTLQAQDINLDSCYAMARRNFPLVKQYALLDKSLGYSVSNANKGYLPQLTIAGQATYQSDVTKIPVSLPGLTVQELSKDQYRLYGEISQPITDLFTIDAQKDLLKANQQVEKEKLGVELYKLRERVNQIYFAILLIDGQLIQNNFLKKDLEAGLARATIARQNGVGLKVNADMLEAELTKLSQKTTELQVLRDGYADMLSLLIGLPLTSGAKLETPAARSLASTVNRPEQRLFELQKTSLETQVRLINARNLPRLSLFFQGGYGKPALNMLSNDFKGYYIAGARLNWNLNGLLTMRTDKKMLFLSQGFIDSQQEVFLFNTRLTLRQQQADQNKISELIVKDRQIVALRERITASSKTQLDQGTATATDYITQLNAEDQARQNLILHQIQLLQAQYNYAATSGN